MIERPSLRPGTEGGAKQTDENVILLYIAQLAALAILLTAMYEHFTKTLPFNC